MRAARCPSCGLPAKPLTRPRRVRRGDREVTFDALYWTCPKGDPAPEGDGVFTFLDRQAAAENRPRLDAAWRGRYGEAAPPPRRAGGVSRRVVVEEREGEGPATADALADAVRRCPDEIAHLEVHRSSLDDPSPYAPGPDVRTFRGHEIVIRGKRLGWRVVVERPDPASTLDDLATAAEEAAATGERTEAELAALTARADAYRHAARVVRGE